MMCHGSTTTGSEAPSDSWQTTHFLTKPVYQANQRPMPRWVGWLLIALPSLAILGTWLVGKFPLFQIIAIVLFVIALWDWNRYFDRSRTIETILGLSGGLIVSGAVAAIVYRPPWADLGSQSVAMISWIALALALVQLYRSKETVLTVIRGWMYAIAVLVIITICQMAAQNLPAINGPFPSPAYLAGSMLAGILLMPVGYALENDHRLRWTYPVAAVLATGVTWTTHRSVAFGCALAVLLIWLATYRWVAATIIAVLAAGTEAFFHSQMPMRWANVGTEPPLTSDLHRAVIATGWHILVDSGFLGVGPGGLASHWPASQSRYAGPYFLFIEIASEYGLAITIAILCALLGVLVWCVSRLWTTKSDKLTSAGRAPAFWLAIMILTLPVTTSIQAQWLDVPLSALAVATLALLARHIESPRGRQLVWSASLGAGEETGGPPDHREEFEQQESGQSDSSDRVGARRDLAAADVADHGEKREPQQHGPGDRDEPHLG